MWRRCSHPPARRSCALALSTPSSGFLMGERLDEPSLAFMLPGHVLTAFPSWLRSVVCSRLHGENTDWLGIRSLLAPRLPPRPSTTDVALVLGAGGTARAAIYALQQMGFSSKQLLLF